MKIKKGRDLFAAGTLKNIEKLSLQAHQANLGKIEIMGKVKVSSLKELAIYYTPGVAYPSLAIRGNKALSYAYTGRQNRIAIITDGSRILGLGNIGPEAGMPVMEGKALLFKKFGNVDAIPLAIKAADTDEIVAFAKAIEPSVGAINIEDIASPRCFEVFERLQNELGIPVFHDDRQGTAIVTNAALKNALQLVKKNIKTIKIVINGSGSAGVGIAQLLLTAGAANIIMCDKRGILYKGRKGNMNATKNALAEYTNKGMLKGRLEDAAKGADVLIGVSEAGAFNERIIKSMAPRSIVFALANPEPEIGYYKAKAAGAEIVATGASDMPNQVNNLLAFPSVFRGLLDSRARKVNTAMLLAASNALAESTPRSRLSTRNIIVNVAIGDISEVVADIAAEVAKAAEQTGVAGIKVNPEQIRRNTKRALKRYAKLEGKMAGLNGPLLGRIFKR